MKILGVESSATAASVALLVDGKITAKVFSNSGLTHSQTLLPMVESVLEIGKINMKELDLVAVSNGPGSFTGVRIGVSAVKGLCQPLEINCMEVSTLEAIAKPLENSGCYAVSVMDARCNQVYTAQFDCSDGFKRVTPDEAISLDELSDRLKNINGPVVLIGDGTNVSYKKLSCLNNIKPAPENIKYQSADSVCLIAFNKFNDGIAGDKPHSILPNYLRLSQAERELKNKQNKGE